MKSLYPQRCPIRKVILAKLAGVDVCLDQLGNLISYVMPSIQPLVERSSKAGSQSKKHVAVRSGLIGA
jgi:hypothetical protein